MSAVPPVSTEADVSRYALKSRLTRHRIDTSVEVQTVVGEFGFGEIGIAVWRRSVTRPVVKW